MPPTWQQFVDRHPQAVLDAALRVLAHTHVVIDKPLANGPHRIFSLAGRIDAELTPQAWAAQPIVAATNHGSARTNVDRNEFDDFHLQGEDHFDDFRRQWSGFTTKPDKPDPLRIFQLIDRFALVAAGGPRSAGLDLYTRSGFVSVLRK